MTRYLDSSKIFLKFTGSHLKYLLGLTPDIRGNSKQKAESPLS